MAGMESQITIDGYFTYSSYYFFYNSIILFIICSISVDRFIFILYTK